MGYAFCVGACCGCGALFTFNPLRVPSAVHPKTGVREPICKDCVERANPIRVQNGLPPIVPHDDAYSFANEEELP